MARKRVIDTEEFYSDATLYKALGLRGMHLYVLSWGLAEDWGGLEEDYGKIALQSGWLAMKENEVVKHFNSLLDLKKVVRYSSGTKNVLWLSKLLKNQPLKNPAPPKLPLPEWVTCEIKNYKSGKLYAKYEVITSRLPVGYQETTGTSETKRNETETKRNGNETETEKKPKSGFVNPKAEEQVKTAISEKFHNKPGSEANNQNLKELIDTIAKDKDVRDPHAVAAYRANKGTL